MSALTKTRFLRPAIITVIAVDVLALGAFSIRVDNVTRTTTTPAAVVTSVAPPVTVGTVEPVAPIAAATALGTTPGTSISTGTKTATKPTTPPKAPSTTPSEPAEPADPATPGDLTDGTVTIPRCPIPIKEPSSNGGLKSLIDFAPAFGPFSAEAFAAASAYQPALQLIGPILAQYPKYSAQLKPALTPFLNAFGNVLNTGFAVLGPLYAPYRQQVLEAESKLANALAPLTQELVATPVAGCVVELQAALLEDSAPAA
ncbi:MAG: hypothetical protein JWQ74_716 [Marmoricola sp.]|nr:hypothetical protein [Marmoricola sp.]